MVIVRVQGPARNTASSGSSMTVTLSSTPTNGNTLILGFVKATGRTITGISQTNVTWDASPLVATTSGESQIWRGVVGASAGKIITISFSGNLSDTVIANVCEYNALLTTGYLDKTKTNSGSGTTGDTGTTATTTQAVELFVGVILAYGSSICTQSFNTYTLLDGADVTFGIYHRSMSYLENIASATGAANGKSTIANTASWYGCIVTLNGSVVPTLTTQDVTDVEETTATGNGNITNTGGENCTKKGICWNTTGTPTVSDFKTEQTGSFGTGAYSEAMTSLSPGTLYYVRPYAYNSAGYGYGSQVTFTTKPNDPSGLSDTARTNSSISIGWTKGSGAEKTNIMYRTDTYPTGPTNGTQGYFDIGSSGVMTSLSPGQIYYYRAWSYCELSPGNYSDGYAQDTGYTTPGDPSSLGCTVVDSHQINLAWTKGTGGDKTKIVRKIDSYPTSITDGDIVYFDTGTSYNNTGLVGGVHYYYRAWAYDSDSGYYSDSYSESNATTTVPTLPISKIFVTDRDNNMFRVDLSTIVEEKSLSIS